MSTILAYKQGAPHTHLQVPLHGGVHKNGSRLPTTLLLLVIAAPAPLHAASDAEPLLGLKDMFANGGEVLSSWDSTTDRCSDGWLGIGCVNNRVAKMCVVARG